MNTSGSIVVAIDGTSASGKSTNARLVARKLGFVYVDTGAMYRTLAWYCDKLGLDVRDSRAVERECGRWRAKLMCFDRSVHLYVDSYFPREEIRSRATAALVPVVAAIPRVREWMKQKQRECLRFGSLVMEGRDIGSNIFPETDFKFYLDASLGERSRRRQAEGIAENLEERDRQDSRRSSAPLMVPLGAVLIDTSGMTPEQSSQRIVDEYHRILAERTEGDTQARRKSREAFRKLAEKANVRAAGKEGKGPEEGGGRSR